MNSEPFVPDTGGVLIQVQHLMGIGHLQRAMALAERLVQAGHPVTVASGGFPVPGMSERAHAAGVYLHQLPGTRASDLTYKTLLDEHGVAVDDAWRARRIGHLTMLARKVSPRIVLTETWPFGRRSLAPEFEALLHAARDSRPDVRVLASIRDILEGFAERGDRVDRVLVLLHRHFDGVLVHGDPGIASLGDSFVGASGIRIPVVHTGYVGAQSIEAAATGARSGGPSGDASGSTPDGLDEVIVSAGGGVVGRELMETAIDARAQSVRLNDRTWRILVGHNLEQALFEQLSKRAAEASGQGIIVERNRNDFRGLLARAAVSVSQAGYNTAVDVMATGVRAVLVPFRSATQHEQKVRARAMARHGLAVAVDPTALDAGTLASAVDDAFDLDVVGKSVALDGATMTAEVLGRLLADGAASLEACP